MGSSSLGEVVLLSLWTVQHVSLHVPCLLWGGGGGPIGFAFASSAVTGPRQNLGTTRFALHVAGGEKRHQEAFGVEGQPCWVGPVGHLTHSCENVSAENWNEHRHYSSILLSNVPTFFGLIW